MRKGFFRRTLCDLCVLCVVSPAVFATFTVGCTDPAPSRLLDGPVQYLSQSGLYTDPATHAVDPLNRPFKPTYELWSDGGAKKRWVRLPDGGVIDTTDPDKWIFPVGTTIWKEFSFLGKRVETRQLEKADEGFGPAAWIVSTFLWNADESDATRVNHGRPDVAPTGHGTMHDIPSVDDCATCHDSGGDVLLGFSAVQLAGAGGGVRLADLMSEGRLSAPRTREPVVPGDDAARQVYGELHANCAHCHNPSSPGRGAESGLFLQIPAAATAEADLPAVKTSLGTLTHFYEVPGRRIGRDSFNVEAGNPAASALAIRLRLRDDVGTAMPPIATEVVDTAFADRVDAWIEAQ